MNKPSLNPQRRPSLKPLDLMATTAHELKSPLVLINGLAGMLSREQFGKLNSRQVRYISRIDNASERLLTMVENLLIINRSHHGRLSLSFEPVPPIRVITKVLKELQPRIKQKHMTVIWPADIKSSPVLADEQLLYQVFYNLFDNSLKYSPAKTTLTIKFRLSGQFLRIQINDQGFGIRPSDLDKLFERFGAFQKPISSYGSSSGLGLYIVKNLVDVMGGQVTAKRLKQGTSFNVCLPVIQQLELFTSLEKSRPGANEALPTGQAGRSLTGFNPSENRGFHER